MKETRSMDRNCLDRVCRRHPTSRLAVSGSVLKRRTGPDSDANLQYFPSDTVTLASPPLLAQLKTVPSER